MISEFDAEPEPWVQAGDFFRRRRLSTGTEVTVAATDNLLLDMAVIRGAGWRCTRLHHFPSGCDCGCS